MKLTKIQFAEYILAESTRLFNLAVLEEQKTTILKEEADLKEGLTMEILSDPIKLKKYRQALQAKAKGWVMPEHGVISEDKYSKPANKFIGKEIGHLMHDKGYPHEEAVAAAINVAKDKGYKVPENKNENMDECGMPMEEEKGWPEHVKKGRFTAYCERQGFSGGPSKECAEKAMKSDDASVRGMAQFYVNTVKP